MTFQVKKTGSMATPAAVKRKDAGSFTDVGFVKAMEAGSWVVVWPILTASITNRTVSASGASAGGATAGYMVSSDGDVYEKIGLGSYTSFETWLTSGANTNFEVRFTLISSNGIGSLTGTLNTWLATTSDNALSLSGAGVGQTAIRGLTVEIRETLTNTVLDTASVSLEAERL